MTRRRVLAVLLVLGMLAVAGAAQGIDGLLRGSVKSGGKSKSYASLTVVHHVGFWSHQDDFVVTGLRVEQREPMRASQPHAKISIAIEGTLRSGRRLKELYVREQFRNAASGKRIVEVVIVPVVEAESKQPDEPDQSEITATAEYTLHQYQWPDNEYVIVCGRHARDVRYHFP